MNKQLKILIVEDEYLERKALEDILNVHFGHNIACESCGEFNKAFDLVLAYKPDIILMDIHLGSGNGIELSKEILLERPATQIIVITAYDYSHYSRQAVSIGIKEFLLKPVSEETITSAVQKRIDFIRDEEQKAKEALSRKETISKAIPLLQKQLMTGLWYGILADSEEIQYLDIIGFSIPSFYCIAIQILDVIEDQNNNLQYGEQAVVLKIISKMVETAFSPQKVIHYQVNPNTLFALIGLETDRSEYEERETTIRNIQDIKSQVVQQYGVSIRAGISKVHDNRKELNSAVDETKIAICEYGAISICHYSDITAGNSDYSYPKNIEQLILRAISKGDNEQVLELFYKLLNESGAYGFQCAKKTITRMIVKIIEAYSSFIYGINSSSLQSVDELVAGIMQAQNIKLLELFSVKLLNCLLETLGKGNEGSKETIIERAVDFIVNNYKKNISLEEIAEDIHISQYYLSRVFKQKLGINISQYLISIRLDNAKKLLVETDKQIKEISIECGFNDPNYFCKTFKKDVGLSPTEYRNKIQRTTVQKMEYL